jgi:hypothetical protein
MLQNCNSRTSRPSGLNSTDAKDHLRSIARIWFLRAGRSDYLATLLEDILFQEVGNMTRRYGNAAALSATNSCMCSPIIGCFMVKLFFSNLGPEIPFLPPHGSHAWIAYIFIGISEVRVSISVAPRFGVLVESLRPCDNHTFVISSQRFWTTDKSSGSSPAERDAYFRPRDLWHSRRKERAGEARGTYRRSPVKRVNLPGIRITPARQIAWRGFEKNSECGERYFRIENKPRESENFQICRQDVTP